ncbi:MAG: YIP1 family protein [Enterobacterales bacterium]|nr:YIP1 family protein [Enterobacterales bacterium]
MVKISTKYAVALSVVTILIMIPIMYVVQSVYFVIMSNIYGDGIEFKQWYSFISWSSLPNLVAILASFAYLATSSNAQIAPDSINQLSLNELIFGLEPSKGIGKLLSTLHLAQFWSFAVMTIGYSQWTKKPVVKSASIVLTPYVIFYIAWFLFI